MIDKSPWLQGISHIKEINSEESLIGYRRQYVDQLKSEKENLILDAFKPLIEEDITAYKGRLHCIINHKGIETYYLDEIPVIEIHPLKWDTDYDGIRSWDSGPKLTACYQYRILWKGEE